MAFKNINRIANAVGTLGVSYLETASIKANANANLCKIAVAHRLTKKINELGGQENVLAMLNASNELNKLLEDPDRDDWTF